jgi:hypothetical protein
LLEIKPGDVTMIRCEEAVCLGRKAKAVGLAIALSSVAFFGCRSDRGAEKATGTSGSSQAQDSRISPDVGSARQPAAPGSPEATAAISGKQLPPPDPPFGGVIKEKASESRAWWAPRVVPPKGAPNVLLIMTACVPRSSHIRWP